jgi:hypothetical protein
LDEVGNVPAHPLDPWDGPKPPKKSEDDFRDRLTFVFRLDPELWLPDDSIHRVERELRRVVYEELGKLDFRGSLVVRSIDDRATRGIEIYRAR